MSTLLLYPAAVQAERLLAVEGDVGFGGVGAAPVSSLQAGLDLREGNFALGLQGRLRLVLDETIDERVGVRRRDYDEASDYVHILRYLRYRRQIGPVELEVHGGELLGTTLGHGTLLRDYSNIADPDHPHAGASMTLRHDAFDLTALVDNVIHPSVVAARLGIRPLAFAPKLTLGSSLVVDPRAPRRVLIGPDGRRGVDSGFNLQAEQEVLALAGLDVELAIGQPHRAQLVPYADLNTSFHGVGLHLGSHGRLALGRAGRVVLAAQAEYRVTTGGYAPAQVDTFYDVTRYQAGLAFDGAPLADSAAGEPMLDGLHRRAFGGHGLLAQLSIDALDTFGLKTGYRHHAGPDPHRMWVRATLTPMRALSLGAMIVMRGLGQPSATRGLAVLAEGRYRIGDHYYALAQYTRSWALRDETRYYAPLQVINVGLGATWSD